MTIGELARAAGAHVETIRFYQRKALLVEPMRHFRKIRRYGQAHLARLRFIKAAQRLGFTLDEIAELLRLDAALACGEAAQIAGRHLAVVQAKIADLERMEKVLSELITACGKTTPGTLACPLIAALQQSASSPT
ncbi:MAG: MerR family transcriptional regulator [Betaproteobacteria bacterium HGW-Betaproteobacteria-11]|nr:MAG: MerR family transcriptional regulator [Betaproteobacteria bacterium HGW-Betaproteobacteria-11]